MIPILLTVLAGLAVIGAAAVEHAPVRRPLMLPRFMRIPSDRRIRQERLEYDDEGVVRDAIRYTPCDWNPVPWELFVWTDEAENAEVFALVPHPEIAKKDLRVSVNWSSQATRDKQDFVYKRSVSRDERFHNRLIHHYTNERGSFLIEVEFQDEEVAFLHPGTPVTLLSPARLVAPLVTANPFEERLARFIRIQEQYEAAKEHALRRELPPLIERAALDELEQVFQDEVEKLEEKEEERSGR